MKIVILVLSGLLISFLVQAQEIDRLKLDKYLEVLEANEKFMGSVSVLKNGQTIYAKQVGYCNFETNSKPDNQSKYRIGSVSKTFTAVLILKAIEEKKLSLEQTLDKYYPEIKNADRITIEDMLYHRSGLYSFTDDEDYLTWNTTSKTEKEMLDIMSKGESKFEPGSKFNYSNPNYVLLSFILQRIYQKSFAAIIKDKIGSPLGLKNTYFGGKISHTNNECLSYIYENGLQNETETDMSIPMGAGGVVSTAEEITIFADALFNEKLISKASLDKMITIRNRMGMGIFILPFQDKNAYGHNGAIDGFTSIFSYFPEDKIAISLLSNATNYSNNDIAIKVLSAVYNIDFEIPEFKVVEIKSDELDNYLGVYSTPDLPLKLTMIKNDVILIAQATGQPQLELEATSKNTFNYDRAGIVIIFEENGRKLILKQGGGEFIFTKE